MVMFWFWLLVTEEKMRSDGFCSVIFLSYVWPCVLMVPVPRIFE